MQEGNTDQFLVEYVFYLCRNFSQTISVIMVESLPS